MMNTDTTCEYCLGTGCEDCPKPDFKTVLMSFIAKWKAMKDDYNREAIERGTLSPTVFEPNFGSKYVGIFEVSNGSRSCYAFVEKTTGNIYKPAGWRAPTTKHVRGNIYSDQNGLEAVELYGVRYMR